MLTLALVLIPLTVPMTRNLMRDADAEDLMQTMRMLAQFMLVLRIFIMRTLILQTLERLIACCSLCEGLFSFVLMLRSAMRGRRGFQN